MSATWVSCICFHDSCFTDTVATAKKRQKIKVNVSIHSDLISWITSKCLSANTNSRNYGRDSLQTGQNPSALKRGCIFTISAFL